MSTTDGHIYKYQVGGSLEKDAPSYVVRQADAEFYDALNASEFCYVLNSRQMGKSSLRVQTMRRLQAVGIACGVVDITSIGSHNIGPPEWYLGIVRRLARAFGIKVNTLTWWNEREGITPVQRLSEFIEEVLLVEVTQKLVIFIDEIDSMFKLEFKDDFFAWIRVCYNQRADKPDYRRLTFALLGVATPSDLIQDKTRTPFNIGKAIDLHGVQLSEALPLAQGLLGRADNPQEVLRVVLSWTGGQPFLTQKLCNLILESNFHIPAYSEAKLVDELVISHIITNWEAQDEPPHLRTIRDRVLSSEQRAGRLLGLYQRILQHDGVTAGYGADQMELGLTGLVVRLEGKLRSYNNIYARVFNQEWLRRELANLRPYAEALDTWVASDRQDESRLLRGQALQDAQNWASGKSLSDPDYQFLSASQQVDRRDAQIALEAERKAKQVLAHANQKAQQRIRVGFIGLAIIALIAIVIGALALGAQKHLAEIQEGTRLEQEGGNSLRQFKSQEIEALLSAMRTGQKLQELIRESDTPLDKYPATSPLLALQTILDSIHEQTQFRHGQDVIHTVSFSPDGKSVVTASDDNTARLWDLSGTQRAACIGHHSSVLSATFSPDGTQILTASQDGTARLWDLTGKPLAELRGHENWVWSASFSPDGKSILTGSWDGTARLWNLSGKQLTKFNGHEGPVLSAIFSSDGTKVLTASADKTARLWDLSGKQLTAFIGHQDVVQSAMFSPDGTTVLTAAADKDKTARLWDLSGKELTEFKGHQGAVLNASFSPDGTKVLTASADKTARLWDISGKQLTAFIGHQDVVQSATFSSYEERIITTSKDGTARIWDVLGNELMALRHQGWVENANCSPIGNCVVTASWDGTARLWDLDSQLTELKGHTFGILSASFSRDGRYVLTTSKDGTVRLWNSEGQTVTGLKNQGWVRSAIFSPNGQHILTATQNGTVQLWTFSNGRLLNPVNLENQGVARSITFSLNGQQILTASEDGTARLWDLSGRLLAELRHPSAVLSASFSPDAQRILTASQDGIARLWGLSGNQLGEFGHPGAVLSASFSPDGQRILTASQDGTARLWGLSGNQLGEFGHPGAVLSASFSPDGQRILTASQDGIARLWDLSANESIELGYPGSVLGASFSPDGQRILTTSQDGTARLWDLSGRQLAELTGQGTVLSASFSPDGQHIILTASNERIARLWQIEGLNQLMIRGCKWLKYYFATHPKDRETLKVCCDKSDLTTTLLSKENKGPKKVRNVGDESSVFLKALFRPDLVLGPSLEMAALSFEAPALFIKAAASDSNTTGDSEPTQFLRFTLTDQWRCDDGGTYFFRQVGDELWWYGEDAYGGGGFSNVFHGQVHGKQILGHWVDVPKGVGRGAGEMSLEIVSPNRLRAIRKTGNFGGSEWTRR